MSKLGELPPNPTVLEIGGGEGFFVGELLKARPDARISLVEPQADPSLFPADKVEVHKMLIEEWLEKTPPQQYDVIVAMDLIEHLRDPSSVMKRISEERLKLGGTLVITTPDAGSLFRRALGRFWPHYKVEHLTYPSTGALEKLACHVGLDVVEMKPLAKPLQIGYLIAVLRNFGPLATRWLGRISECVIPDCMRAYHVRLPSGELLFVGRKSERALSAE
jgi:cyclopropane fatty-acyl-phospholipid synthase-like methyltransferase